MQRILLIAALLVGVFAIGTRFGLSPASAPSWGPAVAHADGFATPEDGDTFVSADEGSAYLWRRIGDRIELVGQCLRTEGDAAQATYVWLPGVERQP